MTRYRHRKYTWTKSFAHVEVSWQLVGPVGGLHFHVGFYKDNEPSAGLEYHHSRAANYRPHEAPDHTTCWLTGEPCWHDGTSLYASETLWPMIEPLWKRGDHESVFAILEHEADRHFGELAAEGSDRG